MVLSKFFGYGEVSLIGWNTIDDLAKNKAKHWSPENLEKIMAALEIKNVADLIKRIDSPVE